MSFTITTPVAEEIRNELALAAAELKASIDHYIAAGVLLLDQKAKMPHGEWLPWLKEHVGIDEREAQRYMRVAEHREQVREFANTSGVSDLSLSGALKQLSKPKTKPEPKDDYLDKLRSYHQSNSEPETSAPVERERLDAAPEPLRFEWTDAQRRKSERVRAQLEDVLQDLDNAERTTSLGKEGVVDTIRKAATATRLAAGELGALAFSFE